MRIQELDPEKRYIVSLAGDVAFEDVQNLREQLKGFCADALVVAGADIQPEQRYWGIWCESADKARVSAWARKESGDPFYYPHPGIAQAIVEEWAKQSHGTTRYSIREFQYNELELRPKDVKK